MNTGLSLINPDMTIAWVNAKTRGMFPGKEPVGQLCHVFYESKSTICEGCGTLKAFMNGEVCESEQLVPATGRWYYIISQPIKDTAGRVVNVLEGITDITERKLAEEALRRLNRELRAISDCNQVLMRAENERALLDDICRIICDEAGYRLAWVGYVESDDAKTIRPVAWGGVEDGYLEQAKLTWAGTERGRGPSGTAIRTGITDCIQDFATDPRAALWRDSALRRGYRSSIALPLKDESARTFGVLNIYSTEPNAFTPDETRLLEELSGDTAFGIMILRGRAERKQAEEALKQIEWMLSKKHTSAREGQEDGQDQGYGDLTALNRDGVILESVGHDVLGSIAADYLDLLGTSSAIYELNGDYAFGIFASHWCRMLDRASRKLCDTDDNAVALNSGQWLCHESCWTRCSKEAIATRAPVDIECSGGIRLYGVPIVAGETVIGSINFGYGDVPKDPVNLRALATAYHLDYEDLLAERDAYDSRPPYIIEMAKSRLHASARLIGMLVERKWAEELLQQREREFRALVENSQDIIARYDRDCRRIYVNPVYLKTTQIPQQELLGTAPAQRSPLSPAGTTALQNLLRQVLDSGVPAAMDLAMPQADHTQLWFNIHVVPEFDQQGRVVSVLSTSRDITERKRAEEIVRQLNAELESANKELEAFSYSVSHDLRAPLRHLTGFVGLLTKRVIDNLDEKSKHYLTVISSSVTEMGKLIDDILSFSRMGRAEMIRTRVGMGNLLEEVLQVAQADLEGRDIVWKVDRLPDVYGSREMLRIVWVNLVSNAIKFTSQKSQAMIEIGHTAEGPGEEVFYVRDNGAGFDMRYEEKLFGLFQRLHRTDEFEGTGLGLANVRRIIHRHGGRTWAEGAVGEGAAFYFSLPKVKEEQ